jgi:hypothetical protein
MARLLVGLVLLGAALSLAAQEMPGIPTGKSAPPFRVRDRFAKEQTLASLMGLNGCAAVLPFHRLVTLLRANRGSEVRNHSELRRVERSSNRIHPRHGMSRVFSFRMISDTRIECRNANSEGETAWIWPAGRNRGGAEPRSSGAVGLDGFLSSLR